MLCGCGWQVVLELQGACGSCPSSSMTMKFGLERGLREKIPEILAVEQVSAEGALLTEEAVEEVRHHDAMRLCSEARPLV